MANHTTWTMRETLRLARAQVKVQLMAKRINPRDVSLDDIRVMAQALIKSDPSIKARAIENIRNGTALAVDRSKRVRRQ